MTQAPSARKLSSIPVTVPVEVISSPERLAEEVPEQALLMAALEASDTDILREEVKAILADNKQERKENVYYIDTKSFPNSENRKFPLPTKERFVSGSNEILDQINKMFLSAPGSLKTSGDGIIKEPVDFFNYLHTSTISSMLHRAELSLVLRNVDGEIEREVPFKLSTSNNSVDIESMLTEKYDRGFGVALENISIVSDAQDPALSKFVTCDITIRMANGKYLEKYPNNSYAMIGDENTTKEIFIEDLFKTDKHEIINIDSKGREYKKYTAEIMLRLGYTNPLDELIPPPQRKKVKQNLHNMMQTFFLKIADYDIIAEQSGQIVLNLKYVSSFDADMDSKTRKVVPDPGPQREYSKKTSLLNSLQNKARNYSGPEDVEDIHKFIAYSKQAIAVSHQKSREGKVRDIIKKVTGNGQKSFVLPYEIAGMPEYVPDQVEVEGNVEKEEEIRSAIIEYRFASPTTRNKFLRRTKSENLDSDRLRAIEFVLFGEIIDYVFEEFFSKSSTNDEQEFAQFKTAIFSAMSFGIYDSEAKNKIEKIYNMRDIPVSLDLLWDALMSSSITEVDTGGIAKSRYYTDMVSKTYSSVYQSCDKAVKILSGSADRENTGHMIRRIGVPEINAHEIYLPKTSFNKLHEIRKSNHGSLSMNDLQSIFLESIQATKSGSRISDTPDPEKYCLVLFFTSHIPFSPATKKREPDYIFKSFGQYGIIKSFSYSPVTVDGLLESAIATRTKGENINGSDDDSFYKSLLKVDISTFGFPTVVPGMTIEISEALLGMEQDSRISNSLTTSYFVTRVQTTMNKGDYTTVIEGYPRLPSNVQESLELKKNNTFEDPINKNFILETMLKSYQHFLQESRLDPKEKPSTIVRSFIDNKFFAKDGIEDFFFKIIEKAKYRRGGFLEGEIITADDIGTFTNEGNVFATGDEKFSHGPGKWGRFHSRSRTGFEFENKLFGEIPYKGIKDRGAFQLCMLAHKKIVGDQKIKDNLDKLKAALGITEVDLEHNGNKGIGDLGIVSVGDYIRVAAKILKECPNGIRSIPSRAKEVRFDFLPNALLFIDIIDSCCQIWTTIISDMVQIRQFDEDFTSKINEVLNGKLTDPKYFGLNPTSRTEMKMIRDMLKSKIKEESHNHAMHELREKLVAIMKDSGG